MFVHWAAVFCLFFFGLAIIHPYLPVAFFFARYIINRFFLRLPRFFFGFWFFLFFGFLVGCFLFFFFGGIDDTLEVSFFFLFISLLCLWFIMGASG